MKVTVNYHHEAGGVWADSPDVEGLAVAGENLAEVRALVREGLEFYLDDDDVDLRESMDGLTAPLVSVTVGKGADLQMPSSTAATFGVLQGASVARKTSVKHSGLTQVHTSTNGSLVGA